MLRKIKLYGQLAKFIGSRNQLLGSAGQLASLRASLSR